MKKTYLLLSLYTLPLLAFAQAPLSLDGVQQAVYGSGGNLGPIKTLVTSVGQVLNALIPILIVIALLVFFWGLIDYIRHPEFKKGKDIMIAGIIGVFVMVSVWGIVRLVQVSLGVNDNSSIDPPQVPLYR